ncbi:class I SAM-dependent methyltransferase [Longimicrobium terrae]|uniref:Demethylmenaquinone methyltransferase n=1 Tax=Longimicrobium terrae TaxID=1639882 RepID=A0A841GX38_9BACT|nr:class I SAM-dependent methyltransferase [Longimicrobium terrae]MBB4634931.1 demethylmenaquinone methyltransferase/2-methoxy-6-polyprenyl-1,4-benzoquinol methylase [Longimicrobium terrae]MBB6069326.1 demethylmenaquinone methyltransferase/2-methoxy-6-polyprenyl-1,4-benzoquinol methylase [Longimicrobium terrae]NNC31866.1 class I SAM-dependent methyltransferase [Longimicrobium terrae]
MPESNARPTALPAPAQKAAHVRDMFGAIAPRYDLLNHVLSMNIDRLWRRLAVRRLNWQRVPDGTYLDNCAGTLDLAVALAGRGGFRGRVVGSDFTYEMLERGVDAGKTRTVPVRPACADALALPYADATFDGATVGFGVRNLADLDAGLREMARVLKPGAKLVILEFTNPTWEPFRTLYRMYSMHVLPRIGRMISSHPSAYNYLPESVVQFPAPKELARRMADAGFDGVQWTTLSGGIAALHHGTRR